MFWKNIYIYVYRPVNDFGYVSPTIALGCVFISSSRGVWFCEVPRFALIGVQNSVLNDNTKYYGTNEMTPTKYERNETLQRNVKGITLCF